MKVLLGVISILFSFSALANPVAGEIFYVKKDGELARRAVSLEVPSMGKGEVVLSGNNFEWRTTDFWTTKRNGEVIFTAAFQTQFMGMTSTIALEGTYLKGSNEIVYNGNFYKKKGHDPVNGDISDFDYNGCFTFNFIRN